MRSTFSVISRNDLQAQKHIPVILKHIKALLNRHQQDMECMIIRLPDDVEPTQLLAIMMPDVFMDVTPTLCFGRIMIAVTIMCLMQKMRPMPEADIRSIYDH